jgi:hypothetical protein
VASEVLVVPRATMGLGAPAGGSLVPSRSPGSKPPNAVDVLKHCCVAAAPVNIFARSKAQTLVPRNDVPALLNKL